MSHESRGVQLRMLLSNWRARLRPEDVGLPMTVRRRVAGLRREEVAELVGVSPNWYALFELGSNDRRFSPVFVQRVADALRLDGRERALLFRLALPEIRLAVEQLEQSAYDGTLRSLRGIRSLVRRISAATTFAEAAETAVEAVSEVLSPSSVAVAILVPEPNAPRVIAAGPRAHWELEDSLVAETCMIANYPNRHGSSTFSENRARYKDTAGGSFTFEQRTSEGDTFSVAVAADAPNAAKTLAAIGGAPLGASNERLRLAELAVNADEYWGWNSLLEARSVITHGLFANGQYRGNLCALWTESRTMGGADLEILRTASAIVELASAPGSASR